MMLSVKSLMMLSAVCILACSGCSSSDMTLNKQQAEAQRNLGEVYIAQGQYTTALQELLKAEALYPDDPYLQNSLGTVYAAKGKIDQAIVCFTKALALKPDYAPARNNLGSAYLLQKNWDAAITCLMELTKNMVYATPHFPLYNIGWAYYNKRNYEKAESFYLQALDMQPGYARALWGLGLTYTATGKSDAALEQFQKAVQKEPQFVQAYLDLGNLYEARGNKTKAREAYERIISISPEGPLAQKATAAIAALKR